MATYLLKCRCGNQVSVEVGRAGGQVTCKCGAQLDVPPLRQLRHLPVAAAEEKRSAVWGTRQGVLTVSLLLAVSLAAASIWSRVTQPTVPKFDPAVYGETVEARLKSWTPGDAWMWWIEYYRPLAERGFPVFEALNRAEIERQIAHRQVLQRTLWIAAAVFAATAGLATFWPKPAKTRRQGDTETRSAK